MKAKEVIILILILLAGVGFHYLEDWHLTLREDWLADSFKLPGRSYDFEENLSLEPADILEIVNSHGAVRIEGTDRQDISLTIKKTIWDRSETKAGQLAAELKLKTAREGTKLLLFTNRNDFHRKNFSVDFSLKVPASTAIKVSNSFGLVRITGVKEAEVNNDHGQVDLLDITGQVKASNSFEKLSLLDIDGACQVVTNHSPVSIVRISGPVSLEASFEEVELIDLKSTLTVISRHSAVKALRVTGPLNLESSYEPVYVSEAGATRIKGHHSEIEIDNLTGQLEVETSYEPIKLNRIKGDINLRGKSTEIDLNSAQSAEIFIDTSYEDVNLENFAGSLRLNLAHADASLSPASLNNDISVHLEYGDLSFFWPAGEVARLEARSKGGSVDWQLPLQPDENSSNGLSLVKAFQSAPASPAIKLSTTYGEIRISQQQAVASAPQAD
ncbi:MAG: DUF4097 family beta strand repeat-containing protein [Candidatus Aminicenantales bacterium]